MEVVAQIRSRLGKICSFVILFPVPLFLACKISDQQLRLIPMDELTHSTLRSRCRFSIRPLTSPTGVHGECDGNGQWPLVAKAALMHVLWKMKREAAESWGC